MTTPPAPPAPGPRIDEGAAAGAAATQQMLDDRYGRRTSARRRILFWGTVGVLAVALIVTLGWSTVSRALTSVSATATGFRVVDEGAVTVTFQITAPLDRPVACALEAQDEEHGVVGWRIVEYPASADRARAFTEEIPTVAAATTGLVNACWVT
jgi:hypothetical protein